MAGDLPPELLQIGATYLHDPVELASYKFTGQNLVAAYQYIFLSGIDAKRLADYAEHVPVRILANTTDVQAVRYEGLRISEIVFYAVGHLSLRTGMTIEVDQPCMDLLREDDGALELALSAPRGPLQVDVSLQLSGGTKTEAFDLRGSRRSAPLT